jgi:hypothetical protein
MPVHAGMLRKRLSCLSYVVIGAWVTWALVLCWPLDDLGACHETWLAAGTNAAAVIQHTQQLDHVYIDISQNISVVLPCWCSCAGFGGLYTS